MVLISAIEDILGGEGYGFLQTTQMVLISAIEDILGGEGYAEKLLAPDVDVGTCGGVPQRVTGCARFRIVDGVDMVLFQVAVHLYFCKCFLDGLGRDVEMVVKRRAPAGGRCERQVLGFLGLVLLTGIHVGEGILKVEVMDGVEDDGALEAQELCIALMVAEDVVAIDDGACLLKEDEVGDGVGKEGQFGREYLAAVIHAEVELPRAFGLQVMVALFEAERAMMDAETAQLAEVRSAESAGGINAYIEVGRNVIDSSDAARHTIEVA